MSTQREIIHQEAFSTTVADALAQGEAVKLRVQGVSMLPWLREGDSVRILPVAGRPLHRGDVVLFWRAPNHPILHRIVRVHRAKDELVYKCLGDSERGAPESVSASAVIGVVESTTARRWVYFLLNPPRRFLNHLCRNWGLRLHHE